MKMGSNMSGVLQVTVLIEHSGGEIKGEPLEAPTHSVKVLNLSPQNSAEAT